jgi:hypothetical protein
MTFERVSAAKKARSGGCKALRPLKSESIEPRGRSTLALQQMAASSGPLNAIDVVRRTNAAHASAHSSSAPSTPTWFRTGVLHGPRAFDAKHPPQVLRASGQQALQVDHTAMMREVDDKLARGEADVAAKLARGEAEVEEKRAAVERDRAELDDEKARMRAAAPPPDGVVKLNVGGVPFKTSRSVLTKVDDSMLGRMFGRCDAMLQLDPDDGSIFIDRDGERFRLILDFLRDLDGAQTQKSIGELSEAAQEAMVKELDYFGLEVAVFGARPWTDEAAFRPGPGMDSVRDGSAAVSAGGRIVVFGGVSDETALNTTLLLDAQTMVFTAGPNLLTGRYGCAAVQIDADRVLLVGGMDDDDETLNTMEIFHLATLTSTPGPDLVRRRHRAAEASPRSRVSFPCDLLSSPPLIPRSFYLSKLKRGRTYNRHDSAVLLSHSTLAGSSSWAVTTARLAYRRLRFSAWTRWPLRWGPPWPLHATAARPSRSTSTASSWWSVAVRIQDKL